MLEGMGNEGMEKGGMMEGWGWNGRVMLVFAVSPLIDNAFRRERE